MLIGMENNMLTQWGQTLLKLCKLLEKVLTGI